MTPSQDKNSVPSPDANGSTTDQTISYSAERIIGNGSFGVVFQAAVVETGEVVAIKKVLQDKRFKNRELQIMRQLVKDPHSNIVGLKHCFYSQVSLTFSKFDGYMHEDPSHHISLLSSKCVINRVKSLMSSI